MWPETTPPSERERTCFVVAWVLVLYPVCSVRAGGAGDTTQNQHNHRCCSLWLQVLLVIRGLKKECDYGYPIDNKRVGVILYFENING